MYRINSTSSLLFALLVCCVQLAVNGAAIPQSDANPTPQPANNAKHQERLKALAQAGNMGLDELEQVRANLDKYRQSRREQHQVEGDRKQTSGDEKLIQERVARMKKVYEQHAANATSEVHNIPEDNLKAGVAQYLFQGDILLSVADSKRLADGKPLRRSMGKSGNASMPAWWHNMGKHRGSGGSKTELAKKIKKGLLNLNNTQDRHVIQKRQGIVPNGGDGIGDLWPTNSWSMWPYIPYYFDSSVSTQLQNDIRKAVNYWNTYTCLWFNEDADKNTGTPRLKYKSDSGGACFSQTGRDAGATDMTVTVNGWWCAPHESGHAVGFIHQMSRYDRDNYIEILLDNVETSPYDFRPAFDPLTSDENNNYGFYYDYGSIMQYFSNAFGDNGAQTTAATAAGPNSAEWDQTLGSNLMGPSMTDYKVMNKLYNCAALCAGTGTLNCNSGYQNPNDCGKCICPPGVGGTNCQSPGAAPINAGYAPSGVTNQCSGGGLTLVSNTNWVTMSKTIGQSGWNGNSDHDAAWCHWYLQANSGYHITIEVQSTSGCYGTGCSCGYTEVRMSNTLSNPDWSKTGRRFCGPGDLQAQGTSSLVFNSIGRGALISTYTTVGTRSFTLRYKVVAN